MRRLVLESLPRSFPLFFVEFLWLVLVLLSVSCDELGFESVSAGSVFTFSNLTSKFDSTGLMFDERWRSSMAWVGGSFQLGQSVGIN
ncbi:hypothetical protein COP1_001801 [Malus domestica]